MQRPISDQQEPWSEILQLTCSCTHTWLEEFVNLTQQSSLLLREISSRFKSSSCGCALASLDPKVKGEGHQTHRENLSHEDNKRHMS